MALGFCEEFGIFDAEKRFGGDRRYNFLVRMQHIRDHILEGDCMPSEMRMDGFIVNHLRKKGLIDEKQYQDALKPRKVLPGAKTSPSHKHLPPAGEEVVAGPSSRSRRGSERRREKKRRSSEDNGGLNNDVRRIAGKPNEGTK